MITVEDKEQETINPLPSKIQRKFRRAGNFYVCTHFNADEVGPPIARIKGTVYYRFMDFLYLPQPPESLTTGQIIEICDLRLAHMDQLVITELNERIVAAAVAHAQADGSSRNLPVRALDFGCGSGFSSILLKKYWPELSLIGVDISAKAVARSREQHLEARLVEADQPLPFEDAAFDIIFAIFVMHFNLGITTLTELKRVLRSTGKFVFNVYQRDIDGVIAQLQDAGFGSIQIQNIAEAGQTHRMVMCRPGI